MMTRKPSRWILRFLCAVLAAMLCACSAKNDEIPDMTLTETMPKTKEERDYPYFETELYFATSDNQKLLPETRRVMMPDNGSHIEAAIKALFDGASTQSQQAVMQSGLQYEKMELSTSVCNVYVKGNVVLDEKQWLITRAAIAATVNAVDGTGNINLYYNQLEPGYMDRPLGAQSPIVENLDVYVRNLELEYEALKKEREEGASESSFEMRSITLYFVDEAASNFITQNSMFSYDAKTSKEKIAELAINNLTKPLDNTQGLQSALPNGFELISVHFDSDMVSQNTTENKPESETLPAQSTLSDGDVLNLVLAKPKTCYDMKNMCGALTMTLTGFIPNICGIRISIQDHNGNTNALYNGEVLTRTMFSDQIGHTIPLDYPLENGTGFATMNQVVAGMDSYTPSIRLQALLDYQQASQKLFPNFSGSDVKDIYITGNTAVIDWKEGFSKKLKTIQETGNSELSQERRIWLFLYSIINTMTEFPGVQKVWMLENGQKLGTQGGVYLGNALMRNPGVLVDAKAE